MSELASRLGALRRQAGGKSPPGPSSPPVGADSSAIASRLTTPVVAASAAKGPGPTPQASPINRLLQKAPRVDLGALRRMAGVRERLGQPRLPPRSFSRDVPGEE